MGAVLYSAFLAVALIFFLPSATANNFSFPFLPPFFGGNACEENVCGKGKCINSNNSSFGFECECEAGWRQGWAQGWTQARVDDHHDHSDDFFKFLPCVIPNCTFNYTCTNDAPAPVSHNGPNRSFFDPCFWSDCGGGSCNATSPFTRTCLCEEGYYNLLNSTAFPCYKDCSVGLDCKKLGLDLMNTTNSGNSRNTVADDKNTNGARLNRGLEFGWWITMLATWALMWMKG